MTSPQVPVRKRRGPAPTGHTPRHHFRMDAGLWAQVQRYADEHGTTASDVIRDALTSLLESEREAS